MRPRYVEKGFRALLSPPPAWSTTRLGTVCVPPALCVTVLSRCCGVVALQPAGSSAVINLSSSLESIAWNPNQPSHMAVGAHTYSLPSSWHWRDWCSVVDIITIAAVTCVNRSALDVDHRLDARTAR